MEAPVGASRPLDGLRVVELSIAIAAPSCARTLAFFGADVMKLESQQYPDVVRLFGSAWARTPELAPVFTDTSPYLPEMNAGKRSVGLNLKSPDALAAAKALIAKSDVFITNYSTPAVTDLGLDADTLRALNDRLICVAMPAFGSDPTAPYYEFISWGPNQAPLVGLDALAGYPDQEPAGIAAFAPPDYFAGLHAFMAIMTALEDRERTGHGCRLDVSQFEVTVSSLGPYLLDQQLNDRVVERSGNRVPWCAPQGIYPCAGDDRWVAISVRSDTEWRCLAQLLDDASGAGGVTDTRGSANGHDGAGRPASWAADRQLDELEGRLRHQDELDAAVARWSAALSPDEAAARLQAAGISAHAVHDTEAMLRDPQLHEYRWYVAAPSLRFPDGDLFGGCAMRLTGTPGGWEHAAPSMGEHTIDCLEAVGGLDRQRIDALISAGAAFVPVAPEHTLRRPYTAALAPLGLRPVQAGGPS